MTDLSSLTQKSNLKKKLRSAKTSDDLSFEITPKKFAQSSARDRMEVNQSMAVPKNNFLAIPEEVSSPGSSLSVSVHNLHLTESWPDAEAEE